jgi:ABC-2 type transport system permease protein
VSVRRDTSLRFSWRRLLGVMTKEFIQMRRDRLTFAMMIGIPLIQLVLFSYAINMNPKNLPTALLPGDTGPHVRAIISAMQASDYFDITHVAGSSKELDRLVDAGQVQFAVEIPAGFERRLERGETPQLLVIADATDPAATGNAVAALNQLPVIALDTERRGTLAHLEPSAPPFEVTLHRRYNPVISTQWNIVPGLLGVVLTLTLVVFTALAMTRETERGTMENLLAMPVRPIEVMVGKITPFILVGYIQAAIILGAAFLVFGVPLEGSIFHLAVVMIIFIAAQLSVGFTFSTFATSQLQAMQMAVFYFLPSILLSGFMFPFRGMPDWAQWIGEMLPLTHFLRIVRGILLKGNGLAEIWPDTLWLIGLLIVFGVVALSRYRQTLD